MPQRRRSLTMSERSGVEIDYCPECRGSGWTAASSTRSSTGCRGHPVRRGSDDRQRLPGVTGTQAATPGLQRPKKKEHWLSELFD